MNKLPVISGKDLAKFFDAHNFTFASQKGSHVKMISRTTNKQTVFPMHKEIDRKTLKSALMMANIPEDELIKWYYT